jgi:DNA-binding winged helix-turn-helix (wHTH) protein/WD40 repeat protein
MSSQPDHTVTGTTVGPKVVRFGVFELDERTGELRKQGVRQKLQGKPFQVLHALLESPGQVVTREELRLRLWPSDVFVDFERGLNTAANRLRIALGDSAENPRYIETLARVGYRFIAPIEIVEPARPIDETPERHVEAALSPLRRATTPGAIAAFTLLFLAAGAAWLGFRRPAPVAFRFHQVTFRRGQLAGARFAPDGHSILYTASWDNEPRQLFLTNPFSPESRLLGLKGHRLVSVSSSGELALLAADGTMPITGGLLSRVPMNGGEPQPVARSVMTADWSPDGSHLAIVHAIEGTNQLEYPVGTVIHKTSGWISSVRIAPRGDSLAFIEHPVRNDNRGSVRIIERGHPARTLSGDWPNAGGLAWHPSSREIWFTASRDGGAKSLWAVSVSGGLKQVTQIAGTMTLRDIAPDGGLLLSRETEQLEMTALLAGDAAPRNLSWLDWSRVADISADGRLVLFDESGIGAGPQYLMYVHHLDSGSTMRLGAGRAMALSPDAKFALALGTEDRSRFRLVPLDDGTAVELPITGLEYQWGRFFPDGRRIITLANEPGRPLRLYVQALQGKPFPISPPTVVRNIAISPEGNEVAVLSANGTLAIYPVAEGGAARTIPTTEALAPLLWTRAPESSRERDNWLYVQHLGAYTQIPTRISRLHLQTGRLEPWQDVAPSDPLGVNAITKVMLSSGARTLVFNYRRVLSELFVAEPQPGR